MTPLPKEFLSRPLAHRGYHNGGIGVPENSCAAFERAVVQGYGIELDVQLSADGEAMVFHDFGLERLTSESGLVRERGRSELGNIKLRDSAETIPALDEVLELIAGRKPVLVEIKRPVRTKTDDGNSLERAVARASNPYEGPVAVMSFCPNAVARFADAAPDIPRGLTTCPFRPQDWPDLPDDVLVGLRNVVDFDRLGATFISHQVADLSRPRVSELKVGGSPVLCWTVRSIEQEMEARRVAHNITFEGYAARSAVP
ncbi:glycerophosphodiester phosphodiesterase family protein [Achromobacter marplatensis]|uniref:glycerophosphodiester phosphodiesterase family protein n=1 Tax=Achromobacter marplatensis TaxID=470868 RepID=UPI003D045A37